MIWGDSVNHMELYYDESFIYDCGPTGDEFNMIELQDYCTLSVEYRIAISPCSDNMWMTSNFDFSSTAYVVHIFQYDKSLLRAIVICLIKVLENNSEGIY